MGRPKEISDEAILRAARRCFVERGTSVTAVEIARELGVSHTTLFNRFGSKEGLLIAALGPPAEVPWVDALKDGPDERPIVDQLIAHAKVISAYFYELQAGLSVLASAGVDPRRAYGKKNGKTSPERAVRALVAWLERARDQGRIADCDIDTLASTLLGAVFGWVFRSRLTGKPTTSAASDRYIERFIKLLWSGIQNST